MIKAPYLFLIFAMIVTPLLSSCEEEKISEEQEIDRKTVLVTFTNNSGVTGCAIGSGFQVTFLVTYRDIQASLDIGDNNTGFLNVLVEDGESINVKAIKTEDDTTVGNADVNVRTDSRPESFGPRTVEFCKVFELKFINF